MPMKKSNLSNEKQQKKQQQIRASKANEEFASEFEYSSGQQLYEQDFGIVDSKVNAKNSERSAWN